MRQEYLEKLKLLKIMDDDFARIVFQDSNVGLELLRILHVIDEQCEIIHYETQKDIHIPNHKSAILDVFVMTEKQYIDIEIENHRNNASPKRARLYSSEIDVHISYPKEKYDKLPQSIVIFICSFDYFKAGIPYYTIERRVNELGNKFDDESKILYVNGEYEGNDEIGHLIHDLKCTDPNEMKNEVLRNRVKYFKEQEGGQQIMCKIWDDIRNDGKQEGLLEGKMEGIKEGKIEGIKEGKIEGIKEATLQMIQNIMLNLGIEVDKAMNITGVREEEKEMYRQLILENPLN